jgi:membrane-bound lytic murein transglycosylase F
MIKKQIKLFAPKVSVHKLLTFLLLPCIFILSACETQKNPANLQRIIDRGYVTVGTLYGNTSYYLDAEGPAGFEYELAQHYADHLGVELKMMPSYNLKELFEQLDNGSVDLLAAGLAVTDERLKNYHFSPSYDDVSQKLVFKQGNIRPRSLADLTGTLKVLEQSSHVESLVQLKLSNPELSWSTTSELDSEELLLSVLMDEIDYTIADSNALAISRRYYPEISIGFTIRQAESLAWMINKYSDDSIFASLIEFFGQVHHNGILLALNDKHYGHIEEFNYVDTRMYIKAIEKKLPEYKPLFKKYGQEVDWRLLAAISYQESHWDPHARSFTGVRGMMMLTLPTAKQMGIKSRLDAEQSIRGGAKYIKQLIKRMPARVPDPDRLCPAF